MKLSAFLVAFALAALPASATPTSYDTPEAEYLGELCELGNYGACDRLVELTAGRCAGPAWSSCKYSSSSLRAVDNGLMTPVPGFGWSRIETVSACLKDAGVDRFQDLITDSHFETFNLCLESQT
jgi:hypothetical protein